MNACIAVEVTHIILQAACSTKKRIGDVPIYK